MVAGYLQAVIDYVSQLPAIAKSLVLIFSVALQYVFPVFPADTIIILAGFFNARGAIDLTQVILSIVLGTILGTYLGYKIGFHFMVEPYKYAFAERIANSPHYKNFEAWYRKWGAWLLLFNRFIHGIRAVFFIIAGASHMPILKVILLGVLSALMFNGFLLGLGYWLGNDTERILEFLYSFNILVYTVITIAIILLVYWWRKNRHKSP